MSQKESKELVVPEEGCRSSRLEERGKGSVEVYLRHPGRENGDWLQ